MKQLSRSEICPNVEKNHLGRFPFQAVIFSPFIQPLRRVEHFKHEVRVLLCNKMIIVRKVRSNTEGNLYRTHIFNVIHSHLSSSFHLIGRKQSDTHWLQFQVVSYLSLLLQNDHSPNELIHCEHKLSPYFCTNLAMFLLIDQRSSASQERPRCCCCRCC